jgi:molybdopterin/thiamine biosynthesis adenylyltransferase
MTQPGDETPQRLAMILGDLDSVRSILDSVEHEVVSLMRDHGHTWEDIGEMVGISRQAARQRFGKLRRRR